MSVMATLNKNMKKKKIIKSCPHKIFMILFENCINFLPSSA